MIKNVKISYGNNIIQQFSGTYIKNRAKRDLSEDKLNLFNIMTGNIDELNNPAFAFSNNGRYPNSLVNENQSSYPSIKGRKLYIPLGFWFEKDISQALPLCSIEFNEITIDITIRPIRELFVVRDQLTYMNKNWPIIKNPQFLSISYKTW